MDAKTLVLTANTETVYGMGFLDLKGDGATVVEAPPKMLGAAMDTLQRFLVDIGPPGPDKGKGGKYLFLPPGSTGEGPEGYFVVSRRHMASVISCAGSRWTERPTRRWR